MLGAILLNDMIWWWCNKAALICRLEETSPRAQHETSSESLSLTKLISHFIISCTCSCLDVLIFSVITGENDAGNVLLMIWLLWLLWLDYFAIVVFRGYGSYVYARCWNKEGHEFSIYLSARGCRKRQCLCHGSSCRILLQKEAIHKDSRTR